MTISFTPFCFDLFKVFLHNKEERIEYFTFCFSNVTSEDRKQWGKQCATRIAEVICCGIPEAKLGFQDNGSIEVGVKEEV